MEIPGTKGYTRTVKWCRNIFVCLYEEGEDDKMLEILFIIIIVILFKLPEWRFDNYMPPEGQRIDYDAQTLDRVRNHLTKEEVMRNTINGKYNTKDFDFLDKYK